MLFAIPWYYLIVISSVFNAGTLILEKRLLKAEHALTFSASISFSIGLLSFLLIPFTTFSLTPFALLLLLSYSVTLALGYWMSARLFRHGSLSTGAPQYNILPNIVVVALGFLLLGEVLLPSQYIAIVIMLAAAFFMIFESNKKRDIAGKSKYDHTITANAIIVGIGWILLKYTLGFVSPITFIFFTSLFTPFIVWLLMLKRPLSYKQETRIDIQKFMMPIVLLAVITITYRVLLYNALTSTQVALAAPFNSALIVMITVLAGGLLFGEHHIPRKILLSAIMIVAAYFLIA